MLSVCLNWLYALMMSWIAGVSILTVVGKSFGKSSEKLARLPFLIPADGCILAGLAALTVYAQFFSIFYKVGMLANLLLMAGSLAAVLCLRREMWELLVRLARGLSPEKIIGYFLLFFLFAYGTSGGIIHYDTSLYHAQSIRWIEEFGVVKGLGNLHVRLAYNSASFSLSALFSFSFLGGQSYHCMAGLFALILAKVCCGIFGIVKRGKLQLSDIARAMGIYYLLIIYDEMVSPASDYFMVLTVFYILIRWMDLLESKEEHWIFYGLLCLLCVYTISLKLSAALILLLALKPGIMLLRGKNIKAILLFAGWGTLILAPCLIRNYLISGWLVYPFTFIDLFSVDWKIPEGIAAYDAKEIQVWGREIFDVGSYGMKIHEWFGSWFQAKTAIDQSFIAGGILAFPVTIAAGTVIVVQKKREYFDWLLLALTVNGCFLFWLFSAPLIRYGCVYVWLSPCITFGILLIRLAEKSFLKRVIFLAALSVMVYKAVTFTKELVLAKGSRDWIYQKDYEEFDTYSYEIEGVAFYYPREGDRAGYRAFPSSPGKSEIGLRGKDYKDGFYTKQE